MFFAKNDIDINVVVKCQQLHRVLIKLMIKGSFLFVVYFVD